MIAGIEVCMSWLPVCVGRSQWRQPGPGTDPVDRKIMRVRIL